MRHSVPSPIGALALTLTALLVALAGGAVMAACGGTEPAPTATVTVTATATPSTTPSTSPSAAGQTTLYLYFLRGEKLGVAERRVPHTTMPATAAVEALLAGPSEAEATAGLASEVPGGTRLRSIEIAGGVATVDLSGDFAGGGGTLSMTARVAEVVYTLTQFSTVKSVAFELDGERVESLGGEGVALADPQRRRDWRGFEPVIFVERPGVGAVLASPFVLSGTASVFEGSFIVRLIAGGERLVDTPVQATQGAPGRGTFRESLTFQTGATRGTLVVFDFSMADGSRLDEVRIPVTFAE